MPRPSSFEAPSAVAEVAPQDDGLGDGEKIKR